MKKFNVEEDDNHKKGRIERRVGKWIYSVSEDGRMWKEKGDVSVLCIPKKWGRQIALLRHRRNHFGHNRSLAFFRSKFY